jgi:hypothetical protein
LLQILQELNYHNETIEGAFNGEINSKTCQTETVRNINNYLTDSPSARIDINNNDVDLKNAPKSEIYSVSTNFSHSFCSSRFIMSSLSMFTDLSRCHFESYQISKRTVRRSSAQTNLQHDNYSSCLSLVSTAEEHFSTKLTNTTDECSSSYVSFAPKSNSSKASLTSLDHRKNSYRPSKQKRPFVALSLAQSSTETSVVTFNVECASTPKKETPRSSTPELLRRSNFLAPENTRSSMFSLSSSNTTSDVFFPTFFSNFVNLISS